MEIERYELKITGIVQGVGFRPFMHLLAKSLQLKGWVRNTGNGVIAEVEGSRAALDMFLRRLNDEAPRISHIKEIVINRCPYKGYADFSIKHSSRNDEGNTYISPDISICPECTGELFDKNNRRYLYPFINCTNCGPRFTITTGVPYDRVNTTMERFHMCDECSIEYNNEDDRRYHAQPVSCHDCGPRLFLADSCGRPVAGFNPVEKAVESIIKGQIIAVKGLGGYHLVCDARNTGAVVELRKRKKRDDRPFALMTGDFKTALTHCHINAQEKNILESAGKPIVLLKRRDDCVLPAEIAPNNPWLGIMLPYTPLHLLLFNTVPGDSGTSGPPDTLVVTSGNTSDEPIYYKDEEAIEGLGGIADFFLYHDRDIHIRTDDSVTRIFRDKEYIIRRSRGYVPIPVTCSFIKTASGIPSILSCGAETKNTFCMNKGQEFYLSHHIGDLDNFETLSSFEEGIENFAQILDIKCETVAFDSHPLYLSTGYALATNIPVKTAVQHHNAHIASCMAENALNEDVIGVAFDGTGLGEDGNIWGGEFFAGGYDGFERLCHLEYVRMPGGDAAVKEPWRMAASYLKKYCSDIELMHKGEKGVKIGNISVLKDIGTEKIGQCLNIIEKNLNCPLTSSMGRLFDAVCALTGIRSRTNYEGQAAIELEFAADRDYRGEYGFIFVDDSGKYSIHIGGMIRSIIDDIEKGTKRGIISSRFHETVANMVLEGCSRIRDKTGIEKVVLSGGVFQNMLLLEKSVIKLKNEHFKVYTHSKVPANDGGISLGQAVMALYRNIRS